MHETSLHSSIKDWYSMPGDSFETRVDDYIIDIRRNDLLIEIQTGNFAAIKRKLHNLIDNFRVRLVYPIPRIKWLVRLDQLDETIIGRRRSPRKGKISDIFYELVRIPNLINNENFTMDVLMIEEEEIRRDDGKGSWRRKGVSIKNRKLVDVLERFIFEDKWDFLRLLPPDLDHNFTNRSLARKIKVSIAHSRKITYCLRKMGAIKVTGKKRNQLFFSPLPQTASCS